MKKLTQHALAGWAWMGTNKDSLTVVFAFVAGITAFWQYMGSVDDGRRKETLKYVERAQDARVGEARASLAKAMLDEQTRSAFDTAFKMAGGKQPNPQALDKFVDDNKLKPQLIILTEHYMNLAGCVKSGICDKSLACDFFMEEVEGLHNSFHPLFADVWLKRDGQNYMLGPMAFVKSCRPTGWLWF